MCDKVKIYVMLNQGVGARYFLILLRIAFFIILGNVSEKADIYYRSVQLLFQLFLQYVKKYSKSLSL